jgi:hypothetical protein
MRHYIAKSPIEVVISTNNHTALPEPGTLTTYRFPLRGDLLPEFGTLLKTLSQITPI